MKKIVILIVLLFILVVTLIGLNKKTNFEQIINKSTVYIESFNNEFVNNCSGFVYDEKDTKVYIVTAYHCISDAEEINVYNMSQNKENALIEYFDSNNDIAILSVNNSLSLSKIRISDKNPDVGDNIYVIGTPLDINYSGTLTHGIVSHINRKISIKKENEIVTYTTIQVDAPISSGNSGSVLVDSKGRAIGMIIIKDVNLEGVSFSIPISKISELLK